MRMYKYETIAEELTQMVKRGEITDRFPSYREMVKTFKCSSRTIDAVVELLKADGIIYSKPNVGLWVKTK